jgi:GTPase SAR1 family protein
MLVFCSFTAYKTTTILLDGKRVKLQLWDTSGQGRFCTIIRSYSRGAQGILLVYDITNKWSFDGIDRWLKEVEEVSNCFLILSLCIRCIYESDPTLLIAFSAFFLLLS